MAKFEETDPQTGTTRKLESDAEIEAATRREKAANDTGPVTRRAGGLLAFLPLLAMVIAVVAVAWMFSRLDGRVDRHSSAGQQATGQQERTTPRP